MLPTILATLAATGPGPVTLHLVQLEQAIGGVGGDATAQAIQLRLRTEHFNPVDGLRLVAHDAAGGSPVTLVELGAGLADHGEGARILVATESFARATGATPDFLLDAPIPESYLAAGSVTLEGGLGIWWRLAWGGAAYTGSTAGMAANDDDGDFGPPVDGPLPSDGARALRFLPGFTERSTTNLDDYELTPGPAVFLRNDGAGFGVPSELGTPVCFGIGCPCGNDDPTAGCASSVGTGGFLMGASGSTSLAADDLGLLAIGLPESNQGLFYMGDALTSAPLFDGRQCAAGATWRFLCCIQSSGAGGTMELGPGIAAAAGGLITPGSTWYFHAWHRDVGASPCGTHANLTSALAVTFGP